MRLACSWIIAIAPVVCAPFPLCRAAPPTAPPPKTSGPTALPQGVVRTIPLTSGDERYTALSVSPDAVVLAAGCYDAVRMQDWVRFWDVSSGKRLPWVVKGAVAERQALSSGSKLLATLGIDSRKLEVWNVRSGKRLYLLGLIPPEERDLYRDRHMLAFSAGGKVLVYANRARITSWDMATGKEFKDRRITPPGEGVILTCLACSSDGKFLVAGTHQERKKRGEVLLYDAPSGRLLATFRRQDDVGVHQAWITEDGRTLAALVTDKKRAEFVPGKDIGTKPILESPNHLRLWELASGREVVDLRIPRLYGESQYLYYSRYVAALSGDGRLFAGHARDDGLALWDTATGKQIHAWKCDVEKGCLWFTENDRTLMTDARAEGMHFYDVASVLKPLPAPPVPDRAALTRLWADLADTDAARARRALWALADAPRQSVPMLAENLKPVPEVSAKRLSTLIADLDAERFPIRAQARADLEKLREQAEPALRKALADGPSTEQRRALTELLKRLGQPITDRDKLRRLRAIEALEHIGTPEAKAILEEVARGAPAALETQSARESLARLARRAAAP